MLIETDVVIIGAGPCGIFQVFELGLLGLRAEVVDSLHQAGGQCMELYPDKPIFDIPAVPSCTARELIERLVEQAAPFKPGFHFKQTVTALQKNQDGSFLLRTNKDLEFRARAIVIAAGVGAFEPRRLRVKGADRYEGKNLHYKITRREDYAGQRLLILGGGDSALDWSLDLYEQAASLTLVHRREEFRAAPESVARMQQLAREKQLHCLIGQAKTLIEEDGRLAGLQVLDGKGQMHAIHFDQLLVFYGLSPKLGPIAKWELKLNRNQVQVDAERFQSDISGIFAVGDINTYPGKKKLILSGFHEAALAAFGIEKYLYPDKRQFLQYTTTSPDLHKRLGVKVD